MVLGQMGWRTSPHPRAGALSCPPPATYGPGLEDTLPRSALCHLAIAPTRVSCSPPVLCARGSLCLAVCTLIFIQRGGSEILPSSRIHPEFIAGAYKRMVCAGPRSAGQRSTRSRSTRSNPWGGSPLRSTARHINYEPVGAPRVTRWLLLRHPLGLLGYESII